MHEKMISFSIEGSKSSKIILLILTLFLLIYESFLYKYALKTNENYKNWKIQSTGDY